MASCRQLRELLRTTPVQMANYWAEYIVKTSEARLGNVERHLNGLARMKRA